MRKSRRKFLAAVGATLAIAGCQDGGGPTPEGTPGGAEDVAEDGATPMPGEGTPTMEGGAGADEGTPTMEGGAGADEGA
jgi:hypothetical protein